MTSERNPHTITIDVSCKLMTETQKVVTQDTKSGYVDLLHEISVPDGRMRLGFYRVVMLCLPTVGADATRTSHLYDIQLMLDLGDDWREHVQVKTKRMLQEVLVNVR
jgi:hypothetical protein